MMMKKINHNLTFGILLGLISSQAAYANPNGAQVVNGQVNIAHPDPNTLAITNSNGAIINWQQFSIQQNEITKFIQSGATSAILNRVVGQDPSAILGQLLSNGRVFLINPNGIVFGPNSIVDTAGLIASTLNMTDEDFINQNLKFQGENAADISSQGYIKAGANGDVFLIAPNIENSGIIETDGGQIILAAGESVIIASLDSDDIVFDVQAPDNEVVNLGEMITNGGAAKMFAGTIKHEGSINANSISVDENGNVQLFAQADIEITNDATITANGTNGGEIKIESEEGTVWNSGTIEAIGTEQQGGHVEVLGERVALLDEASIDASGETDGGEIFVGGDYQGKNDDVKNAKQTYVGENTSIKADAATNGDGGKVIVWADETTQAYGVITARGGSESGDGGFVETSGKVYLDVSGSSVDASAVNGERGMWLLDPNNIEIVAGGGNVNINAATPFVSTNDTAQLGVTLITSALNTGTDVTVTTSTGGTNGQAGDITVTAAIAKTAGTDATLTLNADNDININASITSTTGQLNLVLDAARTTGTGVINLGDGVVLDTNTGGTITATSEAVKIATATTATINSNSTFGSLTLAGSGSTLNGTGDVTVSGLTSWSFGGTIGGTGTLFANGGLNLTSSGQAFVVGRRIEVNGGAWSSTGATTFSSTGKFVNKTGKLLTVNSTGPDMTMGIELENLGTLTKTGAGNLVINSVLTTSGDVNVDAGTLDVNSTTFNWNGGALQGAGTLDIVGVTTFSIGGSATKTLGSFTLAPETLTVGGTGILDINGGTMNVAGLTTINSGATLKVSTATFNPSGTLNNNGLLDLRAGTLSLGAGGTHTGDFNTATGTVLQFTGGTHIMDSGSDTSGPGDIAFTGGTSTYSTGSTYTVSGDTGINGGDVIFNIAAATNTLTHAANILGGTGSLTTTGWTPTGGNTNINSLVLGVGYFGTISTTVAGGAAITNQGSLILNGGTINPTLTNQGSILITGGSNTLSGTVNNNGLLNVITGTLSLAAGGTHTGDFNTAAGTVLQFTGGTHVMNSGSDTSGLGDVAFTGGTSTYNTGSTYFISGDTGINGGDAIFNINAVTNSLTHGSGSFGGGSTGNITTSTWMPTSGVTLNDIDLILAANGTNTLTGINVNSAGTATVTNQGSLTVNGSTIGSNFTNTGIFIVNGSLNNLSGTATQSAGNFILGAGSDITTANLNVVGGTLTGTGTINGNVNNSGGILAAGSSPGTLIIGGNYIQGAGATFQAELAGTALAGTDYDLLSVGGTTSLAGTLDIQLFGGYAGAIGDQFDIIQSGGAIAGDFAAVNVPTSYTFSSTPNTPAAGAYQLAILSDPFVTPPPSTPPPSTPPASTIGEIESTDEIIVLEDFQEQLSVTFVEPDADSEDEEKRELACR